MRAFGGQGLIAIVRIIEPIAGIKIEVWIPHAVAPLVRAPEGRPPHPRASLRVRGGAPGAGPPDARPCGPDRPSRRPAVALLSIAGALRSVASLGLRRSSARPPRHTGVLRRRGPSPCPAQAVQRLAVATRPWAAPNRPGALAAQRGALALRDRAVAPLSTASPSRCPAAPLRRLALLGAPSPCPVSALPTRPLPPPLRRSTLRSHCGAGLGHRSAFPYRPSPPPRRP